MSSILIGSLQQYKEIVISCVMMLFCLGMRFVGSRLMRDPYGPIRDIVNTVTASVAGNWTAGWKVYARRAGYAEKRYQLDGNLAGCLSEEMQHNIGQATSNLRETLEQVEIQNVS
ncbi:hypothetical protein ACNKHX_16920 [Shigella flexneri]